MSYDLTPDLKQFEQWQAMLSPNDRTLTFQTIDDNKSRKSRSLTKIMHGNIDQHTSQLIHLNQQGAGIFATVNKTDGQGVAGRNITAIRCLIADFDNERPERVEQLKSIELTHGILSPSMIVESSQGKHHAYWLFEDIEDVVTVDNYADAQTRLFAALKAAFEDDEIDTSLKDKSKLIRVAGFYHMKADKDKGITCQPFMTKVIHEAGKYEADKLQPFIDSLPALSTAKPASESKLHTTEDSSSLSEFFNNCPKDIALIQLEHYLQFVSGEDYENWITVGLALHHQTQGEPEGLELWNSWSQHFSNYAGYEDLEHRWNGFKSYAGKPVTASTIIYLAKQNKAEFKPFKPEPEQAQDIIKQLAELDTLNYHLQRKDKAALIGITPTALDKVVKEAKQDLESSEVDSMMLDIDPHPSEVDGHALANDIYQIIDDHVICDKSVKVATTLWIFFTWVIEASHFAPIAWINAPEKRCGKSTLLTILGRMSKRALSASSISPAALYRSIEKYKPTLLLDEVDTFINDNDDLRGVLNAGYSRDNPFIIKCSGEDNEPVAFNAFAAKAVSGIGKIPPTIMDRSVALTLRRKLKNETTKRVRELPRETTDTIKAKLARWSEDNLNAVAQARPELPNNINDRMQDNWEILLKVAMVLGNDWHSKALHACSNISNVEHDEPTLNERLLADIKGVFESAGNTDKISTSDLIAELCNIEESPWNEISRGKPMTPAKLARHLKEYGIKSKNVRVKSEFTDTGEEVLKGYQLKDFQDAFKRYLS